MLIAVTRLQKTTHPSTTLISTLLFSSIDIFHWKNCLWVKFEENHRKAWTKKSIRNFFFQITSYYAVSNLKHGEC